MSWLVSISFMFYTFILPFYYYYKHSTTLFIYTYIYISLYIPIWFVYNHPYHLLHHLTSKSHCLLLFPFLLPDP
ncbi:hypothetical protein BDA99DRAFT_507408 [Phascolomyces articulosus]|uniref:Uncharacterized protein n=1 Tax=Phascolomyces articulosus TaxID=60185 RepID=A0AAD5KBH4_9FUNG|nr:hypothetical protein BDA99DRAFT_507408 [Phascolomyces articulosus]